MSPCRARSRCSSNTWLTSPWSRMAMMWPRCDGRDAGGLLAAVLERVQREVGETGDVAPGRADTEDAALVARSVAEVGELHEEPGVATTGGSATAQPQRGPGACRRAPEYPPSQASRRERWPSTPQSRSTVAHQGADRARGEGAQRGHAQVGGDVQAGARGAHRRRRIVLPAARPVADLPRARQGPEGLGRRRQRDVRLPQRVRLDGAGPRASGDRQGDPRALRERHALRGADRGRDRRRRGAAAALGAAALALHELRLGVDDGRDPDRARVHEARHRDEDLRLLPRPSRHGDGLDRRRVRQDRRSRQPRLAALRRRHPAGDRGHDGRRAVQRRRRDGAPDRAPDGGGPQARLRDHGGGDDEPRGRAAAAGLPRGRPRDHRASTASC